MTDNDDKSQYEGKMNAEDLRLLKEAMHDVKPLKGKNIKVPDDPPEEEKPPPEPPRILVENKEKQPSARTGQGLDKRTDERLRRGQMPIEARLDLHGMKQKEARAALERFVTKAQGEGKRCVLVITGKGRIKNDRENWLTPTPGVLKQNVPEWLESEKLRPLILKTHPARPNHGGDGALYVLLRRNRT